MNIIICLHAGQDMYILNSAEAKFQMIMGNVEENRNRKQANLNLSQFLEFRA